MVERELLCPHLRYDTVDDLGEWYLDLGSLVHILELADILLCLHDTDHDDKSRTDAIGFFELYLDTRSAE
jgi:hypothetical protein